MKKHILMLLDHSFPPDVRVENEAEALVDAGYEVTVLSVGPSERPRVEIVNGVRIVRDPIETRWRNAMRGTVGTLPFYTWYLARRLREVHEEFPAHALHVHDLYTFGAGLRASKQLNLPVVGDLHENYVEALKHYRWSTTFPRSVFVSIPRWEALEKQWVRAVYRLIVVIEEARERNVELGVPASQIAVVSNTIRRSTFDGFEVDEDILGRYLGGFTLLYTGGFDVHRGLETVVEAMPALRSVLPGVRLVLVGDGSTRGTLESRVKELGLESIVSFEGYQPQRLLKSYMMAADVCLIPHLSTRHTEATIPHKLFHYMYQRRPVLASNVRPIRRILEETGAGRTFTAGDPRSFAREVVKLYEQREHLADLGKAGYEAVMQRYNWSQSAQQLVALYDELFS
ncbi:MAG: glycosyltransferase family 4 protein [Bacteroidota bacterium]